MLGTSQDITERRVADALLQNAHHQLEERVTERTRQLSIANDDLHVQISERSRAEDALRRSSRRIGNILESIAEAFVALDGDFCFTYINERALDQIRNAKGEALTRDDLLGTRFWDVSRRRWEPRSTTSTSKPPASEGSFTTKRTRKRLCRRGRH